MLKPRPLAVAALAALSLLATGCGQPEPELQPRWIDRSFLDGAISHLNVGVRIGQEGANLGSDELRSLAKDMETENAKEIENLLQVREKMFGSSFTPPSTGWWMDMPVTNLASADEMWAARAERNEQDILSLARQVESSVAREETKDAAERIGAMASRRIERLGPFTPDLPMFSTGASPAPAQPVTASPVVAPAPVEAAPAAEPAPAATTPEPAMGNEPAAPAPAPAPAPETAPPPPAPREEGAPGPGATAPGNP